MAYKYCIRTYTYLVPLVVSTSTFMIFFTRDTVALFNIKPKNRKRPLTFKLITFCGIPVFF